MCMRTRVHACVSVLLSLLALLKVGLTASGGREAKEPENSVSPLGLFNL